MTRVTYLADVHLGNHKRFGGPIELGMNARCRETLAVFEAAVDDPEPDTFIVLGDLFDTTRPKPQLIAVVRDIIEINVPVRILVGNHDQDSAHPGDHAIAALHEVEWFDTASWFDWTVLVPFQPGDARQWLPAQLERFYVKGGYTDTDWTESALGLHLGIIDDDTPPFLQNAHDAVPIDLLLELCRRFGFRAIFAGNWHRHRLWEFPADHPRNPCDWEIKICQVGALVPTGWDNPGFEGYGKVVIWDSDTNAIEVTELPGPRFVNWDADDSPADMVIPETCSHLYLSWKVSPARYRSAVDEARDLPYTCEVVVDRKQAEQALGVAAITARHATTLDEAISAYVDAMPLDPAVPPERVAELSRHYLTGAAP